MEVLDCRDELVLLAGSEHTLQVAERVLEDVRVPLPGRAVATDHGLER